jgi:ech hydrogenase subunit B
MLEILYAILLIPLALLFEGVRRKIVARMHNRVGPPFIQPFYDIFKLFEKKIISSPNILFSAIPYLALISVIVMIAIFPFSVISFEFDFLVLGYIFILLDTFYIIGAISSRSPFGTYASVRELLLMLGYEIAFLIILSVFFAGTGATTFADYPAEFAFLKFPLASILLLFVSFIILRITPYDVMIADPEISAGFFTEYSGSHLAILEIAEFTKDLLIYIMLAFLLLGPQYALIGAPFFLLFYATMLTSSPRYSTVVTVKTFLFLALLAFIDLLFSIDLFIYREIVNLVTGL